ncbi:pentatricopeptide repeat-containing At4g21065-like [Olea europaea subsp. europaea]|uniref:Pentatricopeptide repeat-containing At4g21065-like n=1 Tax=Olea europaea subsp. europaea TaxID=158383 RepID=A0A8S0P9J7_OLEEU|nr:pentatricopeptide repeat-containing At4g21065-like [Olea europaea subsp. europaea]
MAHYSKRTGPVMLVDGAATPTARLLLLSLAVDVLGALRSGAKAYSSRRSVTRRLTTVHCPVSTSAAPPVRPGSFLNLVIKFLLLRRDEVGRNIHKHVKKTGWEMDSFVGAGLIDMYAKCGCINESRQVFDKIANRDVVLWNSMLAAYSQNGHPDECLRLCGEMALAGFRPTEATLVTATSACADAVATVQGRELHCYSYRHGFESNDRVKTALVDIYAKSGNVGIARILFEGLKEKRLVSWNAMITGYAMHGHAYEAFSLFNRMRAKAQPDHITFFILP